MTQITNRAAGVHVPKIVKIDGFDGKLIGTTVISEFSIYRVVDLLIFANIGGDSDAPYLVIEALDPKNHPQRCMLSFSDFRKLPSFPRVAS